MNRYEWFEYKKPKNLLEGVGLEYLIGKEVLGVVDAKHLELREEEVIILDGAYIIVGVDENWDGYEICNPDLVIQVYEESYEDLLNRCKLANSKLFIK